MRPLLVPALCATLVTASCATVTQSRFNPLNWFGSSQEVATSVPRQELVPLVDTSRADQAVDTRPLIGQITDLQVDRTPGGAIITATGLADSQGFFNAQLIRRSLQDGVLTLEFRVEAPTTFQPTGTAASRQISVATRLSRAALTGVNRIVVVAQSGSRQVSR